jgi:hypothetical protein
MVCHKDTSRVVNWVRWIIVSSRSSNIRLLLTRINRIPQLVVFVWKGSSFSGVKMF